MISSIKHLSIIKQLYGKDAKISQPSFIGEHHSLYIVETKQYKNIFRISSKECAFRNFYVSKLLRKYSIPVPNINVFRIDGIYCEIYPFIEGKTLHERHKEGLAQETIKKIYTQLCDICYRMAQIPVNETDGFHLHICKSDIFFKVLNNSQRVIGHCDLNDKNILLDKNDNICAILDLDDVCLKTFELILIHLFDCAHKKGYKYNVESIKEFFPKIYHNNSWLNLSRQHEIYTKLINIKNSLLNGKQVLQTRTK